MNLTVEQRRMVVEYFATKCVEEMPSEEMPKAEFFRDLHSEEWRMTAMKAIEKIVYEVHWRDLIDRLLDYQSFDRDPEGFIHENGLEEPDVEDYRAYMNDNISAAIDMSARY